ncbi:AMP-binding protein [Sphingomonas sp. RB56-2]|uniref:AMP-binding protein n=1 Tax=Sphingomonas brevis TaxID=2908206 RepID=A0ABT0SD25_9SPHN|nr:AMP-binding protein [Sphingomonas brevis]MCL6741995.1 AMP-binding protein [Sphingomonas brevis]
MLSHFKGLPGPPLVEHTIGQALVNAAEQWGDRDAIVSVHQNVRLTWAGLLEQVDRLASNLIDLGLEAGDRIGIWSPNCVEWVLTQFAAARAGLILVTINPAYRLREAEYTFNKVGVRALVAAEEFKSSDYLAMVETLAPELAGSTPGHLSSAKLPTLEMAIKLGSAKRPGWISFDELAARAANGEELSRRAQTLSARDAINIQFTSGTTGMPKGATLSHHNILNNGMFVGAAQDFTADDRLCVPVPLYHCFGMVMGVLACLTHGAAMIFPSDAFEPESVLKAIEQERCTALYGVPTMFIAELSAPDFDKYDLSSLRTGIMAGAICPEPVMREVIERMHMSEVTIGYGMTETSPISFQTDPDDPLEKRVETVGRVQPHLECKMVDGEGNIVPVGTPGELCTKGYSVMIGYWDDPQKTAEAIDADGYMHSGDLATFDEQGYAEIVGRIKDMIIRGGENIYPKEIEEYLLGHPKVEDVAVVGLPDEKYGEEVCAWIRLEAGEQMSEQELRDFCRDQIAHYKIPRFIRFVDAFPMTVTGKVQKFVIREAMVAELQPANNVPHPA